MVEREHTVGLAAAERRLKLNNRFAVLAADAAERLLQKPRHAFRNICTSKKLHWVAVFICTFATGNLGEVGSKLGVLIASLRHIGVWLDNVTPARKPAEGRDIQDAGLLALYSGYRNSRRFGNSGRAAGAAVPGSTEQASNLLRAVGVYLVTQARHRVESTPGIVIGEVLAPEVCKFVSYTFKFDCPCAVVDG